MELFDVTVPSKVLSEIPDKYFSFYFNNIINHIFDKKNKLNSFNTYLEMDAVTRLDLYSDLFDGKKKLSKCEKMNHSRMLYIENLRRRRHIHEFYKNHIDKNLEENNEFIEWLNKEIERVEEHVIWPED